MQLRRIDSVLWGFHQNRWKFDPKFGTINMVIRLIQRFAKSDCTTRTLGCHGHPYLKLKQPGNLVVLTKTTTNQLWKVFLVLQSSSLQLTTFENLTAPKLWFLIVSTFHDIFKPDHRNYSIIRPAYFKVKSSSRVMAHDCPF